MDRRLPWWTRNYVLHKTYRVLAPYTEVLKSMRCLQFTIDQSGGGLLHDRGRCALSELHKPASLSGLILKDVFHAFPLKKIENLNIEY